MSRTSPVAAVAVTAAVVVAGLLTGCTTPSITSASPPSAPTAASSGPVPTSTATPTPAPATTGPGGGTVPPPAPPQPNPAPPTAKPPQTPTDTLPTRTFAGALAADSGGPCYTVRTDDGAELHVYGPLGPVLHRGDVVRVTTVPGTPGRSCGTRTSIATKVTKVS